MEVREDPPVARFDGFLSDTWQKPEGIMPGFKALIDFLVGARVHECTYIHTYMHVYAPLPVQEVPHACTVSQASVGI